MKIRYGLFFFLVISLSQSMAFSQFLASEDKDKIITSLDNDPALISLMDVNTSRITLEDLAKSFDVLAQQASHLGEHTNGLQTNFQEIQLSIQDIIGNSIITNKKLGESLDMIQKYQARISIVKQQVASIKRDYETSKQYFQSYTIMLYKLQNELYTDNLLSDLKVLVKSNNIASSVSQEEFLKIVTDKLQFLLYQLVQQQQSYESIIAEMNLMYIQYQDDIQSFNQEISLLNQQKTELLELFTIIQTQQSKNSLQLESIYQSQNALEKQMLALKNPKKINVDMNRAVSLLLAKTERIDGNKYFSRPILPIKKFIAFYHDPTWQQQEGSIHEGLRVSVSQGSEIFSPSAAVVYKVVNSSVIGSLHRVVLVHRNGLVSILMPLSKILVKEGQFVERGQIIGLSGGKPGTRGAGSLHQPQLYRELLKNGETVDPLLLLESSIFPSKEALPEKYWTRYDEDLAQRTIRVDEAATIPGKTLAQRVAGFLSQYAPEPYNDISVWLEGSKGSGIDPYFGICVGRAETSFKNLKSSNNIGNVGNDDSGNTKEFETPQEGVKAVFNVLNNQYLGNYYTIDQLSRYGNSDGFIYASSPFNWQNNILKCLTSLYGYYIPEDYPFRRIR